VQPVMMMTNIDRCISLRRLELNRVDFQLNVENLGRHLAQPLAAAKEFMNLFSLSIPQHSSKVIARNASSSLDPVRSCNCRPLCRLEFDSRTKLR